MTQLHFMRLTAAVAALFGVSASTTQGQAPSETAESYTVFVQSRPIGQESVAVVKVGDGWVVRGNNRLGPPLDIVMRLVEIHYDGGWHPTRVSMSGTIRGQEASLKTTFANGQAASEILNAG